MPTGYLVRLSGSKRARYFETWHVGLHQNRQLIAGYDKSSKNRTNRFAIRVKKNCSHLRIFEKDLKICKAGEFVSKKT